MHDVLALSLIVVVDFPGSVFFQDAFPRKDPISLGNDRLSLNAIQSAN